MKKGVNMLRYKSSFRYEGGQYLPVGQTPFGVFLAGDKGRVFRYIHKMLNAIGPLGPELVRALECAPRGNLDPWLYH